LARFWTVCICPKTGSTIALRRAYAAYACLVLSLAFLHVDLPAWRCPWGVLQRRLRFRGRRLRPDIGVYDRINAEFLRWIWSFRRTARPHILNLIDQSPCHVVILRSHGQARSFLRSLPDPMALARPHPSMTRSSSR